jgi:hypothetical protein
MNVSTNFLNSKMRRIFVSAAGKYFAKTEEGKRIYKPKAAFRKVGADGSMNKLKKSNTVPTPIRPSMIAGRKTRKNAGGKRMTEAKAYQMIFPGNSAKKVRKVRANKGVARGPREGKLLRQMAAQSNRLIAARKRRAAKKAAKASLKSMANYNPFSALTRMMTVRKAKK